MRWLVFRYLDVVEYMGMDEYDVEDGVRIGILLPGGFCPYFDIYYSCISAPIMSILIPSAS
jgi:hypothetical protein